jgi:hypothetical protein
LLRAAADLMASTPLFLWDHVAAVVFWVALYGVEVALILSVYARYPDSEQAVSQCFQVVRFWLWRLGFFSALSLLLMIMPTAGGFTPVYVFSCDSASACGFFS